jgi:capsular exopolysaccharide synthesis family protein
MVAGVVAGSLLYVITAFLLELRQPSLQTLKEIRHLFDYTLLGMIPNSRKKRVLPRVIGEKRLLNAQVVDTPNALIAQAYNSLQANLKFISPDHQLQTIVVGSSVPQEGRSTVAAKLSVAMASLGSRVLLVDGDLHHPQQHHIWGLINQVGLSQVIVEQIPWYQAIASVLPNLDVLPSGLIPPNSLALLNSQRMESLIREWRNEYDFVIFDTPPLLLLADALTLSKFSDGILLVVRPGVINSASATATQELLGQSGQNVLGLVVNGVEDESGNYYHSAEHYFQASADVELVQAGIQAQVDTSDNHIHAHELLDFFSQLSKNSKEIKLKPVQSRANDEN